MRFGSLRDRKNDKASGFALMVIAIIFYHTVHIFAETLIFEWLQQINFNSIDVTLYDAHSVIYLVRTLAPKLRHGPHILYQ